LMFLFYFFFMRHHSLISFNSPALKICPAKKEGGQEGYHSNRYDFAYNRRCFLGTLKGLIF
jgi:hypothetical protein